MIQGHGGNIFDLARQLGCAPEEIIDMSSNVKGLTDTFLRISLKTRAVNARVADHLLELLNPSDKKNTAGGT